VVVTHSPALGVIWHDLECGGYDADLPLWRELAGESAPGGASARVLDIGCGSGRVALDLARAGHLLTALDADGQLLAALAERAGGMPVETVEADARDFSLQRQGYDLCLVPMQTLQLLRGPDERAALFRRAREHLRPGARLACAIVSEVDCFDSRAGGLGPSPERVKLGDALYLSRAVRVQRREQFIRIERERLVLPSGGAPPSPVEHDVVELEILTEAGLAQELRAAGLDPEPARTIGETYEHSASEVILAHV
jgi:SAM-dependent methyltransferase